MIQNNELNLHFLLLSELHRPEGWGFSAGKNKATVEDYSIVDQVLKKTKKL